MDYQANIFIWLSILGMVRSYILTTSFTCICMRKMSSWNLTTRQNFEFRTCVRQEVSGLTIRVQIPLVCKFYCAKNACKEHKDSRKQALAKKRTKIIVKMQGMVHFRILPQFSVLSIMNTVCRIGPLNFSFLLLGSFVMKCYKWVYDILKCFKILLSPCHDLWVIKWALNICRT